MEVLRYSKRPIVAGNGLRSGAGCPAGVEWSGVGNQVHALCGLFRSYIEASRRSSADRLSGGVRMRVVGTTSGLPVVLGSMAAYRDH